MCWLTAFLLPKESLKDNKHWYGHAGWLLSLESLACDIEKQHKIVLTTSNHKKTRKGQFKSHHKIAVY